MLAAIEVTTLVDVSDSNDGVTSLREAIVSANANLGADEITFADSLTNLAPGTILLADGEMLVTDTLTITGPGQERLTIDANELTRVLNVEGSVIDVTLSRLTITGGMTIGNNEFLNGVRETTNSGGGVRFISSGTLTVSNSTLIGNSTTGDRVHGGAVFSTSGSIVLTHSKVNGNRTSGFGAFGGGVATQSGTVTLTNSTLSDNSTQGDFGFGGGVFTDSGDVTLTNSTLSGNSTTDEAPGGGIYSQSGNVTLTASTLSGNRTGDAVPGGIGGDGGGIYAVYGTVTLTNSTLSNNSTAGDNADGGAIFTRAGNVTLAGSTLSGNTTAGDSAHGGGIFTSSGSVTLSNSTLSGNQTQGTSSDGGAIWVNNAYVTIANSTITGNIASAVGGGLRVLTDNADKKLTIHNSIIAGNTDNGTASDFTAPTTPATNLDVKSSLIGNNSGTSLVASPTADASGNVIGEPTTILDPRLGPLQNNGGPTLTHAMLNNSPAIDAGDGTLLPVATLTDQRGFTRTIDISNIANATVGDGTDIGAVEMVGVSVTAATAVENAGSLDFIVTLSHAIPAGQSVSVEFNTTDIADQAIAGTDYTSIHNQVVTFTGDGPLTQTITVAITDDNLFENDETFAVSLSNAVGAVITTTTVTGTITNDDAPPSVTLTVDHAIISEGTGVATFTASLSTESGLPVTIDLAFDGTANLTEDYIPSGIQIVISPGQLSGAITVAAVRDTIDEADKTIIVDITTVTGASESTPQTATTTITNESPQDFADAPSQYPVTQSNDGARHTIGALFLGATVDAEVDGQPSSVADGDGSDEDGVAQIATQFSSFDSATKSSFEITASGDGKLDAWIDFNQDGDWDDDGEQIFTSISVAAGRNILPYIIPAGAMPGATFARFRLSTAGALPPTGPAHDGEVEDYRYTLADTTSPAGVVVKAVEGSTTFALDADDSVVRSGDIELFRAPASLIDSIGVNGTAADDTFTIDFASGLVLPGGGINIAGADGVNRLVLLGAGEIDLTDPSHVVTDISRIELASDANNKITLDATAIGRLAPIEKTIDLIAGTTSRIEVIEPSDWRMTDPIVVDGRFILVAQHQNAGGEIIQVDAARPYRNFLQIGDVNNSGSVTASDALGIVFELNSPRFSDASGNLFAPSGLAPFPGNFLDVNGDGRVTAADALDVINILFHQSLSNGGSGEQKIELPIQSDVVMMPPNCLRLDAPRFEIGIQPRHSVIQSPPMLNVSFKLAIDAVKIEKCTSQAIDSGRVDEILASEGFLESLHPSFSA